MKNPIFRDQKTFRTLVKALSYPGRAYDFMAEDSYKGNLYNETVEICLSLTDGEVSIFVADTDNSSLREIVIRTNTKDEELSKADYVVIGLGQSQKAKEIFQAVKLGSLIGPDESATCILEVESLSEGDTSKWTGPGIDGQIETRVSGLNSWIETRDMAVKDFPMGFDLILVDKKQRIMGLPRTTKVEVI